MTTGKQRTREEIEEIVNKLGYILLDEYMKGSYRRVVIQNLEGYKWDGLFSSIVRSRRVSFFDVSNTYTLENIVLWLNIKNSEFLLFEENIYTGRKNKLKFFHNIPECQEEFYMSWDNISHGIGCSICGGMQIGKYNNLAYLYPELAKEWHWDNELSPENVVCGSDRKVWWICSECGYGKNKEWLASINSRANRNRGCPACAGKVVTDKNRLSILFSKIAAEWDHDKNEDTPYDVSFASNQKRWWICPKGHSYFSSINNRTNKGNGCMSCSNEKKESFVATELKQWCKETFGVDNVDPEHPMFKNPETGWTLKCDIYIGKLETINGIYIEVHGGQHYRMSGFHYLQAKKNGTTPEKEFKDSKVRDSIKKKFAKKNGIYIEIDLRKIKTTEQAIEYIENIIKL